MNISVYITSYNQKAYLQEAIDSVLAQTLPPRQIIIVDDCSIDGSQALIEGYQSRYPGLIAPIFHAQNQGVAQVRVHALKAVTGDYVTYLDGDDRFLPAKLEKESTLLASRPQVQIAYSNFYYMNAAGQRTGTWVTNEEPPQGDVFTDTLARRFPDGNLFRMELVPYTLWQDVGFYDTSLNVLEDWEMRIRLTRRYHVACVDEPLSEYRVHAGGLSRAGSTVKFDAFEYIWRKHKSALADLNAAQRNELTKRMDGLHAGFMRRQAKEILGAYGAPPRGGKTQAWSCYRESLRYHRTLDWDLLSGLLLPSSIYYPLRQSMRALSGREYGA